MGHFRWWVGLHGVWDTAVAGGEAEVADRGANVFCHRFGVAPAAFKFDGVRIRILSGAVCCPSCSCAVWANTVRDAGAGG